MSSTHFAHLPGSYPDPRGSLYLLKLQAEYVNVLPGLFRVRRLFEAGFAGCGCAFYFSNRLGRVTLSLEPVWKHGSESVSLQLPFLSAHFRRGMAAQGFVCKGFMETIQCHCTANAWE